jgi:GntR family transcriptional regulator
MADASLEFEIQPSSGVPIYRQIMDQVRALVASRRLREGDLLPSIRELAGELGVNMMTVSKAYNRLDVEKILERVRGTGMRVRAIPVSGGVRERQKELAPLAEALVTRGQQLHLSSRHILGSVKSVLKERQSWHNRSSTSAD